MNITTKDRSRALGAAACLALALSAFAAPVAANTAYRADSGSGAYADQIYWMDWTGYSSSADDTHSMVFNLADGSQLSLDLGRSGSGTRTYKGVCSPTWYSSASASSAMGVIGYTWNNAPGSCAGGTPSTNGKPNVVLYPTDGTIDTSVTFTLSNITLTNPRGDAVQEFEIIVADGESLDSGDGTNAKIVYSTTGGNWKQLERLPAGVCAAEKWTTARTRATRSSQTPKILITERSVFVTTCEQSSVPCSVARNLASRSRRWPTRQ